MFGTKTRQVAAWAAFAVATSWSVSAHAQFFNSCAPCGGTPIGPMAAPIVTGPCMTAPVAYNNCPCMQAVPQTVYRDVPVTQYRTVQKQVKQPKIVTVMEERDVTVYKTVTEQRTANVPSYEYQTVTENVPRTVNQSYWRTVYQPVCKVSPCQYDNRPTFLGEMNRLGYAMRSAFTPNQIARREFVPNVCQYQVPVQRQVAIPTTRQVTYNVARVVPVQEKQQVAVQKTIWEDTTVTAYEPYTTTRRVAVGTSMQYAFVDPYGGSTATAANPTPADGSQTAQGSGSGTQQSARDMGTINLQSAPKTNSPPIQYPTHRSQPTPAAQPIAAEPTGPVAARSATPTIQMAGWRPHKSTDSKPANGPTLSVVSSK